MFALPLLLFRDIKNTINKPLKRLCGGQTDRNGPKSGLQSRIACNQNRQKIDPICFCFGDSGRLFRNAKNRPD